jgi:hypothetical protein
VYVVLVTGKCRESHGEELHDFYFSPHIIRGIKSRIKKGGRLKWHMGGEER